MALPLVEGYRLTKLSFAGYDREKQHQRFLAPQPEGGSEKILAISGLFSRDKHLALVKATAEARLPKGSEVVLHNFTSGVNLSLFDLRRLGIPNVGSLAHIDRERERRKIDDEVKQLADDQGEPITIFGYSLGGVLGVEASLRNPNEIKSVITAGAPLGMREIGITERSDTSEFHVVYANRDRVVSPRYATNGLHDTLTETQGGHFSLITQESNINAIVDKFPNTSTHTLFAA